MKRTIRIPRTARFAVRTAVRTLAAAALALGALALPAGASDAPRAAGADEAASPALAEPHAPAPADPTWVKGVLTGIGLLFAFALPVGLIVRSNMPDDPPEPDAHADDHDAHAHAHAPAAHH